MPFIPHTEADTKEMLATLKLGSIDELFLKEGILQTSQLDSLSLGLNELTITRLMEDRQPNLLAQYNFIGAGAYQHHIPAAIWQIVSRGEFYTAYTPYQAEASQGSLQLIYEFQTMMCQLLEMEVANASLYEGASALAEAALMAIRIKSQSQRRIVVATTLHPRYRQVLKTIVCHQEIEVVEIPFSPASGQISIAELEHELQKGAAALVISQPNFFGNLEEVDRLTHLAHQSSVLVIAVVNPLAMVLLKPPGQWGEIGADIVCGEGQPLGIPLSSGGPYFGFMATRQQWIRQLPGRIVGRTTDQQGRTGYTLTLQAREQHIRRSKATSNICTNQGLMVVAATLFMSLMGAAGMKQMMIDSLEKAHTLSQLLSEIPGVELIFNSHFLHEFVIKTAIPLKPIIEALSQIGIEAGYSLEGDYAELKNCLLVCVTETKTLEDLTFFKENLIRALNQIS